MSSPGDDRSYATGMAAEAKSQEVRITDPNTGGQKGSKLARFALLPMDALWVVAEHFGRGALKYADRNWERGYKWSLSYDALLRHLALDMQGEEVDQETGGLHITAVAWHALALLAFRLRKIGTDDRGRQKIGGISEPEYRKQRDALMGDIERAAEERRNAGGVNSGRERLHR